MGDDYDQNQIEQELAAEQQQVEAEWGQHAEQQGQQYQPPTDPYQAAAEAVAYADDSAGQKLQQAISQGVVAHENQRILEAEQAATQKTVADWIKREPGLAADKMAVKAIEGVAPGAASRFSKPWRA